MSEPCRICGDCECDLVTCIQCGAHVCPECSDWGCDEDDDACGDWFCEECVEKAARAAGGDS